MGTAYRADHLTFRELFLPDARHQISDPAGVTRLLLDWRDGDQEALGKLTPIVYQELRRLAHNYMRQEPADHLLQTTALVHEAYMRLVGEDIHWEGREHFYAIAANQMRRILVDYARRRRAQKRGGGAGELPLEEAEQKPDASRAPDLELLALDRGLERLAVVDERKCRVVELRFFGGMTIDETAAVLGLSHATVERELKMARAWLSRDMGR